MRVPISVSRRFLQILLVVGLVLVPAAFLGAQGAEPSVSAPTYDLSWWTVEGGGSTERATSRTYSLVGTVGQADAGEMKGPRYGFVGGFWSMVPAGVGPADHQVYLPLVLRNTP
jgi:hypothetical protein